MSFPGTGPSETVVSPRAQPFTHLTAHGKERLSQRTRMHCAQISMLLDAGLCVNVGRTPANNIDHLLFWSEIDNRHFVALRDALTGKIVTVLPEHFHARSSWKTSVEDQAKARELARSAAQLRKPRFPLVTAGPRPVKDRVACPICKTQPGDLCLNDWGKPSYRVHIERLVAYRELRWREGQANNQPPKKKPVTPEQQKNRLHCTIKVWRMLPCGQMTTEVIGEEAAADYNDSIKSLIAEPSFSKRLAAMTITKGIPFESVFKAIVRCPKLGQMEIIDYPEHVAQRWALRLKAVMETEPESETVEPSEDLRVAGDFWPQENISD